MSGRDLLDWLTCTTSNLFFLDTDLCLIVQRVGLKGVDEDFEVKGGISCKCSRPFSRVVS